MENDNHYDDEYFEGYENYESDEEFDHYADLDKNMNAVVCFHSAISDDVLYHILKLEDFKFFHKLARNLNNPTYKDKLKSGMFMYRYNSGTLIITTDLDCAETIDGTSNAKRIKKFVEGILKKFNPRSLRKSV